MNDMPALVIVGASGFLGSALIKQGQLPMRVKAVARALPPDAQSCRGGITWHTVNLLNAESFTEILNPGDIVVNLAFISNSNADENIRLIDNIVAACVQARVARLLHCSTAVVAGAAKSVRILESTACYPSTRYERTKLAVELRLDAARTKGVDVGILRPTAIVGFGGQNLLSLVNALQSGMRVTNYLRASIFGKRHMHLVPVRNVTAAALHLALLPSPLGGNAYIVSADDDPVNNFQSIERILTESLGLKPRNMPLIPVPRLALEIILGLRGRSDRNCDRIYDSAKLLGTDFHPPDSVERAVFELGAKLRQ
jgi:nucleoside-diphosphate-sugar epimerase